MFKRMAEFGPDSGGRVKVSVRPAPRTRERLFVPALRGEGPPVSLSRLLASAFNRGSGAGSDSELQREKSVCYWAPAALRHRLLPSPLKTNVVVAWGKAGPCCGGNQGVTWKLGVLPT